jgi:hypothetical protein
MLPYFVAMTQAKYRLVIPYVEKRVISRIRAACHLK